MGFIDSISGSRQKMLLFITSCLAFIAMGVAQSMYGPFFPLFRARFGLSAATVATITMMHFTGATLAVGASGFLTRRFGAFPVVITSAALLALGYFGIAASPNWPTVLASTFILGSGFGGLVSLNFLIAKVYPVYAASTLSLLNALFSLGSMAGPMLASPFLAQGSHWPAFLIGGILAGCVVLLFALQTPPAEGAPAPRTPLPRGKAAIAETGVFLLLFLFYVGSETSLSNWIPTHLTLAYSPADASRLTSLFWVSLTAGRLLAVAAGTRFSPQRIVLGCVTLGLAAVAAAHILPWAPVAYAVAGLALGPMFPVGLAWLANRFPRNNARVSSFVVAGGGLGGIFFPPLVGMVVDGAGRGAVPTAISGYLLFVALAVGVILLISKRVTREGGA